MLLFTMVFWVLPVSALRAFSRAMPCRGVPWAVMESRLSATGSHHLQGACCFCSLHGMTAGRLACELQYSGLLRGCRAS